MPPPGFRVCLVVLVGVLLKLAVGDGARRVQGHVSRHAVAVGKLAGVAHGERLPLLCR